MAKDKMNIPQIQFKGFEGDWEDYALHKITNRLDNLRKPVTASERVLGTTPYYGANGIQDYVQGYTHEGEHILVAEDGANNLRDYPIQYVEGKIWVNNHAHVLAAKASCDIKFLSYALKRINFIPFLVGGGRSKLNAHIMMQIKVRIPKIEEQTQIGDFFQKIDQVIELQQKALDTARAYKQSMLQKIFPQKGEKVPRVRFAGFSGDWEAISLDKVADIQTGKLDANAMKTDGEYDFYTSGIQKYKIDVPAFEGPAITIAGNGATVGYLHYADGLFNAYQRTYVLTNLKVNRTFLYSIISKELPRKIHQEVRAGSIPYIVMSMLTELQLYFPKLEEQTAIGNFFQKLDQQIEQQAQKLATYQQLKKAMLQRMFV